jgi:hypothetical protein
VSTILDKYDADEQTLIMSMKRPDPGKAKSMQKKIDDLKAAARASLAALLTTEQAGKWDSMQGAHFKFPAYLKSPF